MWRALLPRRFVPGLVLVMLPLVACGPSTPTGPSRPLLPVVPPVNPPASGLPYREAPYLLTIRGFDGVGAGGGGIIPGCVGIGPSGLGFSVSTMVSLRRAGDSWVGTPTNAQGGDFELTLALGSGETNVGSLPVTGTASGIVHTTFTAFGGRSDARVSFGSTPGEAVGLTASVANQGFITNGTITGAAVFSAPGGPVIPCTPGTVQWTLSGAGF